MNILTKKLSACLPESTQGFQRAHIFSPNLSNTSQLTLEYVVLPTGAESVPHAHIETHTVVYTIQGGVRIYFGDQLENQLVVEPQESVYIPPGVIHHVVNERVEDMIAIVSRTPSFNEVEEFPELLKFI